MVTELSPSGGMRQPSALGLGLRSLERADTGARIQAEAAVRPTCADGFSPRHRPGAGVKAEPPVPLSAETRPGSSRPLSPSHQHRLPTHGDM